MSLELRNLIIGYRDKSKLKEIAGPFDIEIPEKNLIAVIGKNGSGKTTLIKTIGQQFASLKGGVYLN